MTRRAESPGQASLDFTERAAPAAQPADVARVAAILAARGALTAAEIAAALGWPAGENSKRKVRAIARAARPGIVSFPNSDGYKLWEQCTVDEIERCIAAFDSAIRENTASKMLYLNRLHSGGARK